MKKLFLFSMALLISASIFGQRNDNSEYWNTWQYTPKEGMAQKFRDAAAEKTNKFNNTPENAMATYRVITGRNTGSFLRVQTNKKPADYDIDRSSEGEYWAENVSKYVGRSHGHVRWQRLNNGSYNYDPATAKPAKFVYRTMFDVKADRVTHFRRFMSRTAKIMEKRKYDGSRALFRVVSGGNRNMFVTGIPFNTFKQAPQPEQEQSFRDDYDDLYGYNSFAEDLQNFTASLEGWGEYRETLEFEPELSAGVN